MAQSVVLLPKPCGWIGIGIRIRIRIVGFAMEKPTFIIQRAAFRLTDQLGVTPQSTESGPVWNFVINGSVCCIRSAVGIRTSPNMFHKWHFYGPQWIAEALFWEDDNSLSERYE